MGMDGFYDSQLPLGATYRPPIKNIQPVGRGGAAQKTLRDHLTLLVNFWTLGMNS